MQNVLLEILWLLVLDIAFVGICLAVIVPLGAYRRAAFAVLKRNFIGYFSNPTGYVFLCLFVLLTSFAAFWPHEFFASNLANLDQLNKYLQYIMLVFIPAITMSIWSEERRQGTDELLLTLPADDFDIVMGKYLAAASIFTASLLFSQWANFMVLVALSKGQLDTGLFFATYFGYWFVGLAMISVGMVASFLTSNMTVGFILGAMFNSPLAFAAQADVIVPSVQMAQHVAFWSLSTNFDDFGRGVVSLSSLIYFAMIIVLGMYISMVMIGRRHWSGGRDGHSMLGHYVMRTVAIVVALVALVVFFNDHDRLRADVTSGQVSSLSPNTVSILKTLNTKHPIYVDAFISAQVPELYAQTRFNLVSLLKEFDAMSGGKVKVRLHENLEPFSEEASLAEKSYGIRPTMVRTRSQGAFKDEEILLGAAFTCGLEKVVVPFFDYGVPVEYELVRSIGTVAQEKRKKVGVLNTDAQMFGGFSMAGGMPRQIPKQEIIEELEKQYDVEQVDPAQPIEVGKYDVLIVVQPSSLGEPEMDNLVNAVKAGQPTAIFEDPSPIFLTTAPATGEPKQAPGGGMFGMGQQPQPKGDIRKLWKAIGIDPPGEPGFAGFSTYSPDIAWQQYNPYPKLQVRGIPDMWVFASNDAPGEGEEAISSESSITSGLSEILFPVPGVVEPAADSDLKFTPLVRTKPRISGALRYNDYRDNQQNPLRLEAVQGPPRGKPMVLAALIRSKESPASTPAQDSGSKGEKSTDAKSETQAQSEKNADGKQPTDDKTSEDATSKDDKSKDANTADTKPAESKPAARPINVAYVADIDLMSWQFLRIRARPDEDEEINWRFENVTFLLNLVDSLAGEDKYIDIRKRQIRHATLAVVEDTTSEARNAEFKQQLDFEAEIKRQNDEREKKKNEMIKKIQDRVDELKKKQRGGEVVDMNELVAQMQLAEMQRTRLDQEDTVAKEALERDRTAKVEQIRRETDLKIQKIQNWYKFVAVIIPPIPPLLVGLVVFVRRRLREREGVSKARLR
ncbi:MAG: Gldg family protein [Pirellulaceae bacterium]